MGRSRSCLLYWSYPFGVEFRLAAAAIARQCAGFADGIRPLEYPVLPGGKASKDLGFHGFRAAEAQIGFEPGQAIGREARALFEEEADFVPPIDIVERE